MDRRDWLAAAAVLAAAGCGGVRLAEEKSGAAIKNLPTRADMRKKPEKTGGATV